MYIPFLQYIKFSLASSDVVGQPSYFVFDLLGEIGQHKTPLLDKYVV